MAAKISAYNEGNRFYLCIENCDEETSQKVNKLVSEILGIPQFNSVQDIEPTKETTNTNDDCLKYPLKGKSGTLDRAIRLKDIKSVIDTLTNDKNIPAKVLAKMKDFLVNILSSYEYPMTKNNAIINIGHLMPLSKKIVSEFLKEKGYENINTYFEENDPNELLKIISENLIIRAGSRIQVTEMKAPFKERKTVSYE